METNNKPYYKVTFKPNVTRILKDPTQPLTHWFKDQIYPDLDIVYHNKPITPGEVIALGGELIQGNYHDWMDAIVDDTGLFPSLFTHSYIKESQLSDYSIYSGELTYYTKLSADDLVTSLDHYFNDTDGIMGGDMFDMDYEYFAICDSDELLECTKEFLNPGDGFIRKCNLSIV